jgi:protein-tyrosine phosphatase
MSLMFDPTRIALKTDPLVQRMTGTTYHGNLEFDVPYISHIEGNLWMGGCSAGFVLPSKIVHLISLYPWERYTLQSRKKVMLRSESYHYFYDSDVPDLRHLNALVEWAVHCIADGPTLIHCQAGLNRSGLITALVLMAQGSSAEHAIALLREKRSPAVLCNPNFEKFLRAKR